MNIQFQEDMFSIIEHKIENSVIPLRAYDGYVNATELCNACDRSFHDYSRLKHSDAFLNELSRSTGIPANLLVHTVKTGPNQNRGTWVHPQVAINLAQWASPKFAVQVSQWIADWMTSKSNSNAIPSHIRRYQDNRQKIPPTHFSMLDQMTMKLLGALESKGYLIPPKMMPDISLGRMFSKWLRENGYDPDSFPTYIHTFNDGRRPPVDARLYPNELMTSFNIELNKWIIDGRAIKYFKDKDPDSQLAIEQVVQEIKLISSNSI